MDIKGLFFNTDEEIKEAEKAKVAKPAQKTAPVAPEPLSETPRTTFSEPVQTQATFTTFTQPSSIPSFGAVSDEIVQTTIQTYQKLFDSLNQQGYDFYEYFQLVKTSGVDSVESYKMAFKMGEMMEPAINKDKLISQADSYISELVKVYQQNDTKGKTKLADLGSEKEAESKALSNEAFLLNEQLESIKQQIANNQEKLRAIDGKYQSKLDEVQGKLKANDIAKDTLVSSIEKVKLGINNIIQ